MSENPWVVTTATVVIIALSAFFVAIEFALIAAKPHRLEDAATESRSARAALRSSHELTLLLAGSQLGITMCALALGAITKPAVHHAITPVLDGWGMPYWIADTLAFVLALVIVTFLHLVVGEMAPKSWAIAHPERSATLLAIPMRAFMWLVRPLLRALNQAANRLVRAVGVEPVDQTSSSQSPDDLLQLVQHSANVGALDAAFSAQIAQTINLQDLTVADLLVPGKEITAVPSDGTVADVQRAARESGHLRILVGPRERPTHVVHVRETLLRDPDEPIAPASREVFTLTSQTPLHEALTTMRESRNHLAVVDDGERVTGVITLADVLRRLSPSGQAVEAPATV
ncbi:HlyC/CorC family transporter [Aeromicrobium camelliae]|uniref:HlyC/CorC family transporter n=1 Tax=Aeromicrobium camelliae TaxID=1538144 RepID=A0A3N6WXG9_9ACTN|nr:hemolysin family protein [Aeromicrobium camelliae]RQN09732.1 HlyC/CorC family transporter [Aeromicrobium camelliae]